MTFFDNISFFSVLSSEDKSTLQNFCQIRRLTAGEILFQDGDDAHSVYILSAGKLEVSRMIEGQKEIVAILQAEDIIGEMGVFSETNKRNASVIALEDTQLITILDFSIRELTEKYPEIYQRISEIINSRARK